MTSGFRWLSCAGACALGVLALCCGASHAQSIRNYNVNFTSTPPTIDGVVGAGEWDGAAAEAGDWRELRKDFSDVDQDNNRFRILYDANNLYILYQTDYDFGWLTDLGGNPSISFGEENLNLYIDPNRDGDLNMNPATGMPSDPLMPHEPGVDGYQLAFNQYVGTHISTDTDRQGVGFFTEAHVNAAFGDHANWNLDGTDVGGAGLDGSGIKVAQINTDPSGGVAEIIIPFADLDADAEILAPAPNADYNGDTFQDAADYTVWRDTLGNSVGTAGDMILDGADGDDSGVVDQPDYDLWVSGFGRGPDAMLPTGLNATDGADAGEVWGFNMSMISRDTADNFLPIWNWHSAQSFALWPHGTITFMPASAAGAGSSVPEPTSIMLILIGACGLLARRRR